MIALMLRANVYGAALLYALYQVLSHADSLNLTKALRGRHLFLPTLYTPGLRSKESREFAEDISQ